MSLTQISGDSPFPLNLNKPPENLSNNLKFKNIVDKALANSLTYKILALVMEKFPDAPKLEFQAKFLGFTHSIDNIKEQDVSSPVMYGIDSLNRPFFTLKLHVTTQNQTNTQVLTLFRNWTTNDEWDVCNSDPELLLSCLGTHLKDTVILERLLSGEQVAHVNSKYQLALND